jgi:hypothetical protein
MFSRALMERVNSGRGVAMIVDLRERNRLDISNEHERVDLAGLASSRQMKSPTDYARMKHLGGEARNVSF